MIVLFVLHACTLGGNAHWCIFVSAIEGNETSTSPLTYDIMDIYWLRNNCVQTFLSVMCTGLWILFNWKCEDY